MKTPIRNHVNRMFRSDRKPGMGQRKMHEVFALPRL